MLRSNVYLRLACWLLTLFVVGSCIFLEFILPANTDETHFCHAAWLTSQGQVAFADFLFHNSPAIIDILSIGRLVGVEAHAELLFYGRFLCSLSILFLAGMFFLLGRELHQRWFGHFACWIYFPLGLVPYHHLYFKKHHLCIRPEVLVLPLFVFVLATLIKWRRTENPPRVFSSLACVVCGTVIFAFTLRLIPVFVGLIAFAIYYRKSLPWRIPAMALLTIMAIGVYYLGYVGLTNTKTWILQYSSLLREEGMGVFGWLRASPGKFVIVGAVLAVIYSFFRTLKIEPVFVFTFLFSLLGPLMETSPGFPAWQMPILLGSLILANSIGLVRELESPPKFAWLVPAVIALAVIYPIRKLPYIAYQIITQPEYSLSAQVAISNEVSGLVDHGYMNFSPRGNPIAVKDPSFYWTQYSRLAYIIPKISAPPLTLLEDTLRIQPLILHELVFLQAYPEMKSLSNSKLAETYQPLAGGYWIRTDVRPQSFLDVLNSPAGILHLISE